MIIFAVVEYNDVCYYFMYILFEFCDMVTYNWNQYLKQFYNE